nr:hypothetical protein CFP56_66609 [Quercus suber]
MYAAKARACTLPRQGHVHATIAKACNQGQVKPYGNAAKVKVAPIGTLPRRHAATMAMARRYGHTFKDKA